MNLFQLILKQMRQRALSTWLTLLSVVLGVALATAIMLIRRESEKLFGQTDYGYDIIIGAKASPLQLVLNTVYHIDRSPGNIPYKLYPQMLRGGEFFPMVRIAVPVATGDSYKGQRIIGTLPKLFGFEDDGVTPLPADRVLEYRPSRKFEFSAGRVFHGKKFEAVIGSEITARTGLKLGDKFKATHGTAPGAAPDEHDEEWTVVGVLKPTRTAADRVIYISLESFYAIGGHADALQQQAAIRLGANPLDVTRPPATKPADPHDHDHEPPATQQGSDHDDHDHGHAHNDHDHEDHAGHDHGPATTPAADAHDHHDHGDDHGHHHGAYELNPDGTINVTLPQDTLALSAILVQTRGAIFNQQLIYTFMNRDTAAAVNPAGVMREFFGTFLDPTTKAWQAVAMMVNLVAIVAILVSIYNSVSARMRDIAILRALGATRARILTLICAEAGLIGLIGGAAGLLFGHAIAAVGSQYLEASIGESLRWWMVSADEWLYLLAVTVVAVLAGLVPALKAYRSPVAENLVSV